MNELHVIAVIVTIFVVIGSILPFINEAFGQGSSSIDLDEYQSGIEGEIDDNINAGDLLFSVAKMFFWTFGDLPWFLDAMFLILRIMLLLSIVKLLPFT